MATVYAAMEESLLVVRDGEATTVNPGAGRIECVLADGNRAFVGTFEGGLHRSTDGGQSWERVGADDIEQEAVMSLARNPADPDEVWAGTEPSRVYRSTDGGDTWTPREGLTDLPSASGWSFPPRPHTHHVRWLAVDPHDPAHLYVGIEAGALVQTHDRGETWEDRVPTSRRDNHTLATHPDAPGRAWSAAGDGYAETRDGGETWTYPQEGLGHRYVWGLAVDAGDPDTVLVSAASGAYAAHTASRADAYVYRKQADGNGNDDGNDGTGEPWERLDGRGLPMGEGVVRAVLTRGDEAGEFYALNNRGLFRTTDAGDAWTRVEVDWPEAFETRTPRGLAVV